MFINGSYCLVFQQEERMSSHFSDVLDLDLVYEVFGKRTDDTNHKPYLHSLFIDTLLPLCMVNPVYEERY